MKLYALSIIISSILNYLIELKAENYVFEDIKNINYKHIGKYKVLNVKKTLLTEIIAWVLLLCPFGINIIATSLAFYGMHRKNVLERVVKSSDDYEFDPKLLMKVYENQKELDKSMSDSLRLEGLDEKEIEQQIRLAYEDSNYRKFSEEMYEDIKASQQALTFMTEIEFYENLNLTPQERIKLLKEYKKAFLSDSKDNQKPIQKTLKLIDRNDNSKLNYSKK